MEPAGANSSSASAGQPQPKPRLAAHAGKGGQHHHHDKENVAPLDHPYNHGDCGGGAGAFAAGKSGFAPQPAPGGVAAKATRQPLRDVTQLYSSSMLQGSMLGAAAQQKSLWASGSGGSSLQAGKPGAGGASGSSARLASMR